MGDPLRVPPLNLAENLIARVHLALRAGLWKQGNYLTLYTLSPRSEVCFLSILSWPRGRSQKIRGRNVTGRKVYRSLIQPFCMSYLLYQRGIVVWLSYELKQLTSWSVLRLVTLYGWPLLKLAENLFARFHGIVAKCILYTKTFNEVNIVRIYFFIWESWSHF